MSLQEAALYGDLVLYLRQKMAEMLVAVDAEADVEAAGDQLDKIIRDWFFTPQDELYGSAPKDIIWREQLNLGNPIPPEYAHKAFDDTCDCPLCQAAREEIEAGEAASVYGGWNWTYCPDHTLIDIYDPEGSEARWLEERLLYQPQLEKDNPLEQTDVPTYTPPAIEDLEVSPEEFMEQLNLQPQVDERLAKIAEQVIERLDCPARYGLFGVKYRRLEQKECVSLLKGLEEQGVDLNELAEQIKAWPYQNIALDWLSDPEQHVYFTIKAMETRLDPAAKDDLVRFRQHRDFLFILCQLIPYNARLWLQGWLEGLMLGKNQEQDTAWDELPEDPNIPF